MTSSKRRRERRRAERAGGRHLDALVDEAVEQALAAVAELLESPGGPSERVVDVAFANVDEAVAARRRVNEALAVREHLDEVAVWVWTPANVRPPLSSHGRERGVELRIERIGGTGGRD